MEYEISIRENSSFYERMVKEYYDLLKKIEFEVLSPDTYDTLTNQISYEAAISKEVKRLHLGMLSEIYKINQKFADLHWMSEHLKVLHELGQSFTKTFEKDEIYKKAFELVSRVMDTDSFVIAFYNDGDDYIDVSFCIDDGIVYEPRRLKLGEGIMSKVINSRSSIHIKTSNEANDYNHILWGNPEHETNTAIFVPMFLGNQMKGVISVQSYREFAYKKEHEELLRIIGNQVVSAIETARLYDKVYEMSIKDELTRLKNYRAFHIDLETYMAQYPSITLIMLDSDNLKQVNDKYGHHMGDLLITRIAEAARSVLSEGQNAYRYAGDEFMILAPCLNLRDAEKMANDIQAYLDKHPLEHASELITVTVSAGIANHPIHAKDADGLKRVADLALYRSKNVGKNNTTIYASE